MLHAVLLSLILCFGGSNLWAAMDQKTEPVVKRVNFFSDIMGVEEPEFRRSEALLRASLRPNSDGSVAIVGKDGRPYQCGRCMVLPLKDLRRQALGVFAPIRFSVIEAGDFSPQSIANVDIGALQANTDNKGAVFQVASNFNALETRCSSDEMSDIGIYVWDRTQGPLASISAAPGLIYRHYYYFHEQRSELSPELWRQRGHQSPDEDLAECHVLPDRDERGILFQLNLLDELGVSTRNGYVVSGVENLVERERPDGTLNSGYFKILYHQGTQVTFGGVQNLFPSALNSTQTTCNDPSQIIDQIFTAALCLSTSGGTVAPGATQAYAQFVLECLYESTLRAAALHGKRINGRVKVFLTRVGGGAFGNLQEMIDAAIIRAINLPDLRNSGLDVVLNNFRTIFYQSDDSGRILLECVKWKGGAYTVYTNGEGKNIAK